jgi:hypothetical protein
LSKAPVEERIGGWSVGKKIFEDVEYVATKVKYFIMSYNSGFSLVDVRALAVYFANATLSAFPRRKIRQARGRNWKSKWI